MSAETHSKPLDAKPPHVPESRALRLGSRVHLPCSRAALAAAVVIAAYFLLLTYRGFGTYFTNDDTMNIAFLHGYGQVPIGVVLVQALTVITPAYRPMSGLLYRALYALFGLHALPYRIAFFLLLAVNLVLLARWSRNLSNSRFAAAAAALLFAYNPVMPEVYYGNAALYDVLCGFFLLLALNYYVRIRRESRPLSFTNLLILLAFYGAALGSKEMAVSLPGVLLVYEALFHPHFRNAWNRIAPILVLSLVTLLAMIQKIMVPNQMTANINHEYAPHFNARQIGRGYLHYYRLLVFDDHLKAVFLVGGLVALLLLALALRSRVMIFGFLFANLALIPVCVIAQRAGTMWYVPFVGWALYGGSFFSQTVEFGIARGRARLQTGTSWSRSADWLRAAAFGALAITLLAAHIGNAASLETPFLPQQVALRNLVTAARSASPSLPPYSRILLEKDQFPDLAWAPLFILRLSYGDPTLWVDRVTHLGGAYHPDDVSVYAMRLRWDGSQYQVIAQPQVQTPQVPVSVTPGIVRRGHDVQVQLPAAYAGCSVDLAYRMPEDELMRSGIWWNWTRLDSQSRGLAHIDQDAERGVIQIDHLRPCGRKWLPAQGSFVLIP